MKLYSKEGLNRKNLNIYNNKKRKYSFLVSNEGIFKVSGKNITKLIIKNDDVEHINDSNKSFYLDKSEIEFITSNKIPFVYSEQEYDEEIFIVNDDVNIVCVNNETWYAEYSNKGHTRFALNIMLNNV